MVVDFEDIVSPFFFKRISFSTRSDRDSRPWLESILWENRLDSLFESILGGGNSNIFHFHPLLAEMIQFDEHIFQMGGKKPPSSFLNNLPKKGKALNPQLHTTNPNPQHFCFKLTEVWSCKMVDGHEVLQDATERPPNLG